MVKYSLVCKGRMKYDWHECFYSSIKDARIMKNRLDEDDMDAKQCSPHEILKITIEKVK